MKKMYLCLIVLLNISLSMKSQINNTENVTSAQALSMIQEHQADTNFVILDVRTPEEYKTGHIENSVLINFESPDFKEKIEKLDKNKIYLVYCHEEGRSSASIKIMKKLGFSKLHLLIKGIAGWKESGYKITIN